MTIEFVPATSALQKVRPELLKAMEHTQKAALQNSFSGAGDLCAAACRRLALPDRIADQVKGKALLPFADSSHKELVELLLPGADRVGIPKKRVLDLADQIQLLRAFPDPDKVIAFVRAKVGKATESFPRSAAHMERGRNPGDVLDPFLLSATQHLMCAGDVQEGIEAGVSHKCMMILEDLIGNLHQDVIGMMRGNVRVPEPKGESLHFNNNPFPGADVAQVPVRKGEPFRFFQVKNKTGSAKGGDGKRLGDQLKTLVETYSGEAYYVAIVGNTLRGHRSAAGVLKAYDETIILVGEAALEALTRSPVGPELLLRVYQSAFKAVSAANPYSVHSASVTIKKEFKEKLQIDDEELMNGLLVDVVSGPKDEMDSRLFYAKGTGARRKRTGK